MEHAATTLLVANARHLTAAIGAEHVLLALDTERYHSLNSVGSFVWQLLQQPISPAEISREVHRHYEVDLTTAQRDVLTFLQALAEQDLVRPVVES